MSAVLKLTPSQQNEVRRQVRGLLEKSPSFSSVSPEVRQRIAHGLVEVLAFLADPQVPQRGEGPVVAAELSSASDKKSPVNKMDFAGKDFNAGALKAGTEAFADNVKAVDFPKFVSGLIEGVFQSIVSASIRQMDAYGKLLEAVVKSVDQFAKDNFTMNQSRDWMASRHPSLLQVKIENDQPQLALRDDAPEDALKQIGASMGMKEAPSLESPESEIALVTHARLEMARMRQQQLATMVMMGINRIVVTDGLINAKVVFDVKAKDNAKRRHRASSYDNTQTTVTSHDGGGWFSDDSTDTETTHKTMIMSSVDETSESNAELKANLTGEVRVNFKSDYVPLEKMASAQQRSAIEERSQR